ncbi:MAG: Crp/Fnr family transcriptional regulator [Bacteroidota bacterium]
MEEYSGLIENINRYVKLEPSEEEQLVNIIQVTRIRKRQYIDQPRFISGFRNYVVKGAFRSFYIDDDGKDHTVQIAVEDWFISDFYSYITQTPATLFVEALEDSVILQMTYNDIETLCKKVHNISEYFRITTERAFAFSRRRNLSNLSKDAEERYLEFVEKYPNIVHRIPQKVIASYLGISPEFLSRIRGQLSRHS